jgi:signal transduction histidine kinase/CheY-like chemotaxis protein
MTNIAWNEETQKLYEENYEQGMEFTNMNTLFGAVIMTGKPVIANSPRTDPRRGGTPAGHPPLNAFLGIPFFRGNNLMGMVGIANRPGGYSEDIIKFLEPFLITCSNLIEGYRGDRQRRQAEIQLQLTNEELLRATRLKDEFLANMSHELRTPLNAILGNTEILQEGVFGPINDQQELALNMVEKGATHLLALITDILDVAKMEAGQEELDCRVIAVSDLCNHCIAFIKHLAQKKRIQLSLQLPSPCPHLWGDERRISQVLINLLNNAVKFTPEQGTVTLAVDRVPSESGSDLPQQIQFRVTDTGIGIAPENIVKLFKPFIQIDSALNRQYEGTGLGLTLVKQIVDLHGGEVGVHSELGVGSCFSVAFPYNPDINETEPAMQDELTDSVDHTPVAQSPLILLAEDNDMNAATLQSYLEAKGYRVILAKDGRVAIELAKRERPQIILMDIQMPELDGLSAIKQIRLDPNHAETPIIALTALAMDGDKEKCLEAGANTYLSKPVRMKEVMVSIGQFLNPASP